MILISDEAIVSFGRGGFLIFFSEVYEIKIPYSRGYGISSGGKRILEKFGKEFNPQTVA